MINVRVEGLPQLQRQVLILEDRLRNFDFAWDALVNRLLRQRLETQFETGGEGRWPPRVDDEPHPILDDTGKLRASYIDAGAVGHVDVRSSHHLRYGSDLDYGEFHETGTRHLPQRSVVGFAEVPAFAREVAVLLDQALERGLQ